MEIDLTIREVLQHAREKHKSNGIELSDKEILEVFESQFIAAHFAFSKGVEVRLPYFGVFKRTSKEVVEKAIEFFENKELTAEETRLKAIELALFAEEIKKNKKRRKPLTIFDLKEAKSIHKINNRYTKL